MEHSSIVQQRAEQEAQSEQKPEPTLPFEHIEERVVEIQRCAD